MAAVNNQALITLVNGKPQAVVSVFDRGLNYGDGVFETILCRNARPTLWALHLDRLCLGLARLNIALKSSVIEGYKEKVLEQVVADGLETQGLLKIIVTRGVGARGYAPSGSAPIVIMSWFAKPSVSSDSAEHGVSASICAIKLSRNAQLAGVKHLNRLEQVLAAQELQASDADEGLLLDTENNIVEAVSKNIFLVKRGVLYTPLLTHAGVTGVMREQIINIIAPALDITVIEKDIAASSLTEFDEAFVCNSVQGLWTLKSISNNELVIGKTSKLIQLEVEKCLN
jgi:4-amino-4-deoxychorismate lyase